MRLETECRSKDTIQATLILYADGPKELTFQAVYATGIFVDGRVADLIELFLAAAKSESFLTAQQNHAVMLKLKIKTLSDCDMACQVWATTVAPD